MPTDSFTWWLINLAVGIGFMVLAFLSQQWLFAFGGLISIGLMMMNELAGTSTEEGSADGPSMPVFPPESLTQGPLRGEDELTGGPTQPQ
jgi:hypothetical protein